MTFVSISTALFTVHAFTAAIVSGDPTPEEYLARVDAVGEPPFDATRKQEDGYLEHYKSAQHVLYQKKAAILLELVRHYPTESRYAEWMNRRWVLLGWNQQPKDVAREVLDDIAQVTKGEKDASVLRDAAYWNAFYRCHLAAGDAPAILRAATDFVSAHARDERGAALLWMAAEDPTASKKMRLSIYKQLSADYPKTHYGNYAPGMKRRLESMGMPFELAFDDAITGSHVSVAALRGQIVIVDFWATTCVPCVAEMPHLKELYNKNHDRGLAIIGVSLDESEVDGGLKALRRFVKKHDIRWPQYYQGNGYESAFSKSWGVGSAPTMFVLDREGRLISTNAQQGLEQVIANLLDR